MANTLDRLETNLLLPKTEHSSHIILLKRETSHRLQHVCERTIWHCVHLAISWKIYLALVMAIIPSVALLELCTSSVQSDIA